MVLAGTAVHRASIRCASTPANNYQTTAKQLPRGRSTACRYYRCFTDDCKRRRKCREQISSAIERVRSVHTWLVDAQLRWPSIRCSSRAGWRGRHARRMRFAARAITQERVITRRARGHALALRDDWWTAMSRSSSHGNFHSRSIRSKSVRTAHNRLQLRRCCRHDRAMPRRTADRARPGRRSTATSRFAPRASSASPVHVSAAPSPACHPRRAGLRRGRAHPRRGARGQSCHPSRRAAPVVDAIGIGADNGERRDCQLVEAWPIERARWRPAVPVNGTPGTGAPRRRTSPVARSSGSGHSAGSPAGRRWGCLARAAFRLRAPA